MSVSCSMKRRIWTFSFGADIGRSSLLNFFWYQPIIFTRAELNIVLLYAEYTERDMEQTMDMPVHKIAELSRDEVIEKLLHFPGTFKFDFTLEYLQGLTTEQLQHTLLAAYIHASREKRRPA